CPGKRRKLPSPTALPATARITPVRDDQDSLGGLIFGHHANDGRPYKARRAGSFPPGSTSARLPEVQHTFRSLKPSTTAATPFSSRDLARHLLLHRWGLVEEAGHRK